MRLTLVVSNGAIRLPGLSLTRLAVANASVKNRAERLILLALVFLI